MFSAHGMIIVFHDKIHQAILSQVCLNETTHLLVVLFIVNLLFLCMRVCHCDDLLARTQRYRLGTDFVAYVSRVNLLLLRVCSAL